MSVNLNHNVSDYEEVNVYNTERECYPLCYQISVQGLRLYEWFAVEALQLCIVQVSYLVSFCWFG